MLMRMLGNSITHATLVGMEIKISTATLKTVWQFLKKLSMQLPHNPAIVLLGISARDMEICALKHTYEYL